ncbi:MAG TPA: nucleotide exchange factor GrpE [Streptosporangiaceae bacterium]|nr:nucleotide exchange factor GrpE [Streptosporangiaceae bacterium]
MSERSEGTEPVNAEPVEAELVDDPETVGAGQADAGPSGLGNGGTPAEAAARIAELEDQRLRALAELDNMRKRCARQVSEARERAQADIAERWLPVVDNLDRALEHTQADPASIVDGIQAVRRQALDLLAGLGFPRRDDLGSSFDPNRHEAIATRPDPDAAEGSVVEVVRPGYGDGGRQLRPAQVIVAKAGLWPAPTRISTGSWACRGPPARTTSSGRTGSWRGRTTPT